MSRVSTARGRDSSLHCGNDARDVLVLRGQRKGDWGVVGNKFRDVLLFCIGKGKVIG